MYSCAYIAFRTEELVARFGREYNEIRFKDKEGLSFRHLFSGLELEICRDRFRCTKGTNRKPWLCLLHITGEEKVDYRNPTTDQGTP